MRVLEDGLQVARLILGKCCDGRGAFHGPSENIVCLNKNIWISTLHDDLTVNIHPLYLYSGRYGILEGCVGWHIYLNLHYRHCHVNTQRNTISTNTVSEVAR